MAEGESSKRNAGARGRMGLKLQPLATTTAKSEEQFELQITKLEAGKQLKDLFTFDEQIYDAGDRSKVFIGKDNSTGNEVVIKTRKKGFFSGGERVWRQVLQRMLNLERNEHVLGLTGIYEDDSTYYVVMEKCYGGELFDFLLNETDVPERECKRIMREILKAVDHIHTAGLIHRDIKPENIMFQGEEKTQSPKEKDKAAQPGSPNSPSGPSSPKTLKLIDFDTCQEHVPNSPKATRIVGTPGYIAPEAFMGEYTPASDLWSVGVIFYILMTGDMPFSEQETGGLAGNNTVGGKQAMEVYTRLKSAKIDFDCPPWPDFPAAKDLCESLLNFNPGDRSPSAKEALKHPWLTGNAH